MKRVLFTVCSCLILLPSMVAAQEPTSTPVPLLVPELEGAEDAAIRSFTATGLRIAEPINLAVEVVRFDDDDHAGEALDPLQERQFARLGQAGDVSGIKQASAGKIADESRAFAGPLAIPEDESLVEEFTVGLVLVRREEFVFLTLVASIGGDSIGAALDLSRAIVDRNPGEESTPVGSDGMHTGGLWDMLPTLNDVPEGMIFEEDRIPVPFEPLPGQDAAPTSTASQASSERVPLGTAATVSGTWSVTVVAVYQDPHDIDPSATWFLNWLDGNFIPSGQQFLTVRLVIENLGDEAKSPLIELDLDFVSPTGFIYDDSCGNVPGQADLFSQFDVGKSVETTFCRIVNTEDVATVDLRARPVFAFDDSAEVWFELGSDAGA